MYWYIIKLVGEPLAKEALKDLTNPHVAKIKEMLFGPQKDEVKGYLEKLDRQMQEVARSLKDIELRQIFLEYNRADEELAHLFELYYGQKDKPLDDRDRQNTCGYILDINKGVSERARRMMGAFRHKNLPSFKTFFQDYSDKLVADYPDVYSYCDKMDAVMDHLSMNMVEAKLLRAVCYEEIANKEKVTDLALSEADLQMMEQHYDEVVGPARELKELFDGLAKGKDHVRLKHQETSNYLTAYEDGNHSSEDKPFGDYNFSDITSNKKKGMPQVYLYQVGRGQVEKYINNYPPATMGQARSTTIKVAIDTTSQEWKVTKLEGGAEPVRFAFQLWAGSQRALEGTEGGRVYLNTQPDVGKNKNTWWQPILAKDDKGNFETGVFLLRHFASGKALDSDGVKVYAEGRDPAYNNPFMKWRLAQKNTLAPDDFLAPGGELLSQNGQYLLRYENGNLELVNLTDNKLLWDTGIQGTSSGRCVMQKSDGNFVVYDKDKKTVWATNRRGSQFAGSKLVVQDSGFFEIIAPNNESIYDTKWSLTRKHINALEPNDVLSPGGALISQNQQYVLRYLENGNLELFDRNSNKVLWDTGTAGKGAWQCVMQRDNGQFVVFDEERKPVWFTQPEGRRYIDSRLFLSDEGTVHIAQPSGYAIWRKNKDGSEMPKRIRNRSRR